MRRATGGSRYRWQPIRQRLISLPAIGGSLLAVLIISVGVIVYYVFDPSTHQLFPKCIFLSITGYKCIGCGMQRAIHSLLHGDLLQAIGYNAFFVSCLPVIALFLISALSRNRLQRLYGFLSSTPFIIGWVCVAFSWWVLRNVFSL